MASDDEDDYLSDKFLFATEEASSSAKSQTYSERRKQALKQAEVKNKQNRIKSRRERELEAREEGLKRSLFERAKEEEEEHGKQNKAMKMMLRMGFKPGESLGNKDSGGHSTRDGDRNTEVEAKASFPAASELHSSSVTLSGISSKYEGKTSDEEDLDPKHRTVPLDIESWEGKKGVGLGKRASSPGTLERAAKAARLDEQVSKDTFRNRTREAFEERRATGRLSSARRTLLSLDEKAAVEFNILSLDPNDLTELPPELLEVLSDSLNQLAGFASPDQAIIQPHNPVDKLKYEQAESRRLRKQMQLDALQPVSDLAPDEDDEEDTIVTHGTGNGDIIAAKETEQPRKAKSLPLSLSDEAVDEARSFLMLNARDRLGRVLSYLRHEYHYCFWCGTQYSDKADLDSNCPGEDEEAHD